MTFPSTSLHVALEIGAKRAFGSAIDWPGWCRGGSDETTALKALYDYGPRYARILQAAGINFQPAVALSDFVIIERLNGNATTDFGAPNVESASDLRPVDETELLLFQKLLQAYWQALDEARQAASGKELRKGPRGGGRELEKIVQHLLEADASYLGRLAWGFKLNPSEGQTQALARIRPALLNALAASARGEIPAQGPRGGVIWSTRRFMQRVAWHTLDHVWEIEDRILE